MTDNDSCCMPPEGVLEFPCDITVKAMGRASDDLREVVFAIVQKHVVELSIDAVTVKASSGGKFLSVNIHGVRFWNFI